MFELSCVLSELFWPYLALLLLCFIYVRYAAVNRFLRCTTRQTVLFVTSHPDDECMFFAPTLLSLLREGHSVHLVCLSKGDFYGQGDVRKKELMASCGKLGIPVSNVSIIDDEALKDGPDNDWSISAVADRVLGVVNRVNADTVITFDESGVSGHSNHVALFRGVRTLIGDKKLNTTSVFALESTNLVRKYTSLLDIPVSSIFNYWTFVCSPTDVIKAWRSMAAHSSQFVWFRKLYIVFSRYMFVNTLRELK